MISPVKGRSIFVRLVLTFLLIMIPIYALALYIYNWSLSTLQGEIYKSTLAQSHYYMNGLEKEIERMKMLQFDCLNDESLNKLAYQSEVMSIYDFVQNINLLRQRLSTIRNSSDYISNVSAHIATIGRTVSSEKGMDGLIEDEYLHVRAPSGQKGARIVLYQGEFYLSTVQDNAISSQHPPMIIQIRLNRESFLRAVRQFDTYPGSEAALFSLSEGQPMIAQTNKNLPLFPPADLSMVRFEGSDYYTIRAHSAMLNMGLIRYLPAEVMQGPLRNFYPWLWIFTVTSLLLIVLYSYLTHRVIHRPLARLVQAFRKVEQGDLSVRLSLKRNDEFGYLYRQFNEMAVNLDTLIQQVYQQKLLMQRAELKQLQSQINPHFLYNSFFIINTMARLGDDNLIVFSKLLSEYYQFITRNTSDQVTLSEEIRHAFIYTEIQKIRFSRRLSIEFPPCPEEFGSMLVPRLILQPIIENAFNHGVERMADGGLIHISYEVSGQLLQILVEDSGDIRDEEIESLMKRVLDAGAETEVTGLINIHRRLRLVFGGQSGLAFSRSPLGGLMVRLSIIKGKTENDV